VCERETEGSYEKEERGIGGGKEQEQNEEDDQKGQKEDDYRKSKVKWKTERAKG
jgi:hypothetical protein